MSVQMNIVPNGTTNQLFFLNSTVGNSTANNTTYSLDFGTTVLTGLVMLLTFMTNGFVLIIFLIHHKLRTPFSFYIINLLLANLYLAVAHPLRLIDSMKTLWYPKSAACYYNILNDWIASAVLSHAHLLITLNRIWAIIFPISYKQNHTRIVAKWICAGSAIYCHALILPAIITDFVYYHGPERNLTVCDINMSAQPAYSQFLIFVFLQIPLFVILGSYPFLYWRTRVTQKFNGNKVSDRTTTHGESMNGGEAVNSRNRDGAKRPFFVLTVMTLSVFVCWTPTKLANIITMYYDAQLPALVVLRRVGEFLFALQCIVDPILFTLVLRDLRNAIAQTFKRMCKA